MQTKWIAIVIMSAMITTAMVTVADMSVFINILLGVGAMGVTTMAMKAAFSSPTPKRKRRNRY